MKNRYTLIREMLSLAFLLPLFLHGDIASEPVVEGIIPSSMRVSWKAGVADGIPEIPVRKAIKIDELPQAPEDASILIQKAMNELTGPGAVLLPEGTFYVKRQLLIPEGIVFRGQGMGRTHILLDTPDTGWYGSIVIKGSGKEENIEVVGGIRSGARSIELLDTKRVKEGQLLWLFMLNDPDIMFRGHPEWNASWAERAVGQVFIVQKVVNNRVHLDSQVKLDYPEIRRPGVRVYKANRWAGVEGIHFKRLDAAQSGILTVETAENCWIRDCEFENAMLAHVSVRKSKNVTVKSNYIHHAQQYSGGHAYGIGMDWATTDSLAENNILRDLRHGISTGLGANGCVWGYNYLREQVDDSPKDRLRDISIHGNYPYMNLFEGNMAEFATSSDWWGAAGPLNTFFRNRFDPDPGDPSGWNSPLQILYHTHRQIVIGNSMVRDQGFEIGPNCEGTLLEGNLNEGEVHWDKAACRVIPKSLYLSDKPDFWGNKPWPGIGADVDSKVDKAEDMIQLPAADWYRAIEEAGYSMPFDERS